MKQVVLVVAMLVVCSISLFGQTTTGAAAGTWSLGVGAEFAVPVGDFNTGYNLGFGGLARAGYNVDENLSLGVKAGYLSFSGKDVTVVVPGFGTVSGSAPTLGVIPILATVRYFLMPPADMRVYAAGDVGVFNINESVGTKFGFAPELGAQFKAGDNMNVDVHANYTYISTDVKNTTWVGVGIGLEFGMSK